MYAKVLDIVVYESYWKWRSEQIAQPTWAQIEEAIRRLDKFHYPFLHLWPTLDEAERELSDDREWFTVIGGNGEYWFAATVAGQWEKRFLNPVGNDQRVELWTSDQGFSAPDKEVCRDLEVVLRAARFYAENCDYDPSIPWSGEPA
jgi:hypothetical protein